VKTDEELERGLMESVKALEELIKEIRGYLARGVERVGLRGELELVVRDKHGKVKDRRVLKNLIVNVGKAQVAGLINGDVTTPFKYIAIGTGTTSPAATDTGLENETHREQADTIDRVTTSVTNDTARLIKTFSGYSGSEAITESGVFDAASLGRGRLAANNVEDTGIIAVKHLWTSTGRSSRRARAASIGLMSGPR